MSESENMNETKKLTKSYFDVLGICCTSEVVLVEKILKNLEGVKDVSVIVPTKTVIVIHDSLFTSQQQIVKALNQARLEASIKVNGVKHYQKKWPSPFAIGSGVLLALSFLKYFFAPFQWLALGAVAVGIPPIIFRGLAAVRNLTLDINILVLIAVAGTIVLHDYWEAGTIVFLFTIAEWLESRASHKATAAMSSLVNIVPPTAVLAESGEEVNVDEVKLNSILAVKAGETIPIDGVVVEGDCDVDERTLTGESFPVPKQKDSTVWAGTTNLNGYISVKTTALAEDCAVARMAKLVEDAQNNKSKTQRYIDKCAKYYTPVIVAISASLAIVPTALRVHNRNEWYRLALVALVSACPCALVLSTPVAMCCALSKAASSGLLFKGAEYLETLAKIKIMAFDKTGTITRGEFVVTEFRSLVDGFSLNTLLYWVSSIESKSGHPMAAALVDYAQSNSIEAKPDRVEKFQNFPGEGIYGRIDGMEIYVGNKKISSRAGCTTVPEIEGDSFQGKSVGYIFLGSSPAGLFSLSDVCRTGVKDAIIELKKMGIKTVMLTGDCYAAANHVQDQLGGALDEFQAELLPEDKATIIKGFQKEAPTAMIGDGLNDAPALATADIGISMGISGSALANETGHVILMTNDIGRIPKAARLARRVRRKIIENMVIAIGTKAAIVALAIAGYPLVWAAVLADTGTCLLVILNSMLLLRGATRRHGKECYRSSMSSHAHHHKNQTPCCKLENAPQLCCSDIESQKKCTRLSCSSEVCVPRSQPVPSGWADNQCQDSVGNNVCHSQPRPQCCSSRIAAPACQSAVSESKLGKKNCSDSTHKKSCHSLTNSLICISQTSPLQCHSATSSSKSCGSTKCSNLNEQNGCQSHTISQTCSAKKCASACQSAVSGSKSCGSKCSDTIDKNTDDSHPDYQTCMSKMCAPQSQSTTSCSRTCGNTKCSDTTSKNSCRSHTNSESCSSNIVGPVGQTAISGSRTCGNNKCLDSGNKLSFHSNANPLYEQKLNPLNEEKLVEQESFDLVQKDMKSNHDRSRCCSGEEPDHPNSDKAYDSCELQECCYSVQGHNSDISETEIQETAHCDSTNQGCSSKMSALGCQSAISGSKACGDSKCSDIADKNSCHSHTNPQACPSKMCAAQCQSTNTTSRSCGNTKCSDSISKSDGHTQYKSESCLSKMSAPTCQTSISGSTTCGNIKSVDSLNVHGCHSHANSLHEENLEQDRLRVSHGCPNEKQDHSNPDKAYGSCSTQDCCVSVQDHGSDISESGSLEAAHSDRARQSTVVATSCKHKPQDHVNQCGLHSKSTPTDEELAKLVRKCCKNRPCPKVHSGCRKPAAECGPNYRSTINILRDNHSHHFDCSGHKVCSPLEKRQAGGCCESFRKECCAKNNHLAASLGGGLSEIVIE